MKLANYIDDLLYRYDCVIVPNFGGFITNEINATLHEGTHTFYPPTKQVGFNSNLKHNDGLLANYIASVEHITFEKANNLIDTTVFSWLTDLEKESVEIASVGKISLNEEKQLIFEPNNNNFLTDSFGLSSVESFLQKRYEEKVIPLTLIEDEAKVSDKKTSSQLLKVTAAAVVLIALGLGYQQYNTAVLEKNHLAEQQLHIEKKIQEATFVIDNPLPTINLNIAKANTNEFHVIAGAFELVENASKKVNQLLEKGYDAKILGKNKWGLTQVSFQSYETKQEARVALQKIKQIGFRDAWLLVKKMD